MRQLVFAVLIALATVVFAVQNANPVTVKLFLWSFPNASMALVLLITLVLGAITGMLMMARGVYRRNGTIAAQKKRIEALETQVRQMVK